MAVPGEQFRQRFSRLLVAQLFVRFHMTLIFAGTLSAGMIVNRIVLATGLRSMPLRYLLSASAAYGVFFLLIRLWIAYALRAIDLSSEPPAEVAASHSSSQVTTTHRAARNRRELRGPSRILAEYLGEAAFELLLPVLLFVMIVGSLLVAAIYLVLQAPVILVEAAFEVWLVSTLVARAHDFERRWWLPITARATVLPFVYVVVTVMIVAGWLQYVCPAAGDAADRAHVRREHSVSGSQVVHVHTVLHTLASCGTGWSIQTFASSYRTRSRSRSTTIGWNASGTM